MTGLPEEDLIARFFAPLAGAGGLGLLDDAALLDVPAGHVLVLTKDALVEGVHFFGADPPGSVARKALGVNLSDLAAKGACPSGYLLALALPDRWTDAWLAAFTQGLGEAAAEGGCVLLGGDTVRTTGPLMVSITALGLVPAGGMVPRTGAKAGDRLYVTGTIGDGALGLLVRQGELEARMPPWAAALAAEDRDALRDRYWHPRPRLALRNALRHAHGAMDISDGFAGDAAKMLRVSGVSGRLDAGTVPLSGAARAALQHDPSLLRVVLTGGDDYEVLASVPPESAAAFEAAAAASGLIVTQVGEVEAGTRPVTITDASGSPMSLGRLSYSHT